jgi:hypothetical protein
MMGTQLQCSACGALADVPCSCEAPYILPRKRAVQVIAEYPELSDRAIAAATGISHATVSRARNAIVSGETVRTDLDGREREVRRIVQEVTYTEPEVRYVKIVRSEGEPLIPSFVAVPLPFPPKNMIGKGKLSEADMVDLIAIGVRSVLSVLPKDLRSDQRNEARRRIAE